MEFKSKRVKGKQKSEYREWHSDCGQYRISWSATSGVYQACVKTKSFDGRTWWNFAYRRGPYKTRKAAAAGCDDNRKLWEAFVKLSHSDGRRDGRLDTLVARAQSVFKSVPVWVLGEAEPSLVRMLKCDLYLNLKDRTETSSTSESDEPESLDEKSSQESGPASLAKEAVESSIPTTSLTTEATPSMSSAKNAKAREKAARKRAASSTAKKSKSGAKKSPAGKRKKR